MDMKAVTIVVKKTHESLLRGEILDQSVSENEDRGGGGALFREKTSSSRSSGFSYIWRGTPKMRPRGRSRRLIGGPTRPRNLAAWPPFWASGTPSCPSSSRCPSFSIKTDVVFFPDLISCKNRQKQDFAKNSIRFSSFNQVWGDSGTNNEAK